MFHFLFLLFDTASLGRAGKTRLDEKEGKNAKGMTAHAAR